MDSGFLGLSGTTDTLGLRILCSASMSGLSFPLCLPAVSFYHCHLFCLPAASGFPINLLKPSVLPTFRGRKWEEDGQLILMVSDHDEPSTCTLGQVPGKWPGLLRGVAGEAASQAKFSAKGSQNWERF